MVVTFEKDYLKQLYEKGCCNDRRHIFQPTIIKLYRRRIEQLQAASSPESLYRFNALHFEALKGDKVGLFSIRVNDQYRIEFSLDSAQDNAIIKFCKIVELSNHYD